MFRLSVEVHRRTLGNAHPETIAMVDLLGVFLQRNKKLAEAEPFLREALTGFRRNLGETHPQTLASLDKLTQVLFGQGKVDQVLALYAQLQIPVV